MARDLFEEAGIVPKSESSAESASTEGRDLFAEAGISPNASEAQFQKSERQPSPSEKFVNELPKELFQRSHPVAQLAIGAAKPFAGALEFANVREPARFLNMMSKRFEEGSGGGANVLDIAGQFISPNPIKIPKIPSSVIPSSVRDIAGRFGDKAGDIISKSPLAQASLQGAKASLTNPLGLDESQSYGDFLSKKMEQVEEGALAGGALGKLTQIVFNPRVSKAVQDLKDIGMKYFTPGQLASQVPMIGKLIQSIEAKSTSLPVAGGFIEQGFRTSAEDFNKALGNEVLKPMGERLPKNVKVGEDMINYLNERVSDAYDAITPKLKLSNMIYKDSASQTGFTSTVKAFNDKLAEVTQGLPSAKDNNMAGMVREEFNKHILDPLTKLASGKVMSGEEFRNAERNLGRVAFNYMKKPETYDVGLALRQLQGELRDELSIQNPAIAKELRGIHDAFIRHLPVERAASFLGAENRIFSPSQFQSAVKSETKGKGKFASGKGTFYPESQAALEVLGKTIPDSGTAGRFGAGALLTGGGYGVAGIPGAIKALALPTIGAAAAYNKPVMGALTAIATERPELMRKMSPMAENIISTVGGLNASRRAPADITAP